MGELVSIGTVARAAGLSVSRVRQLADAGVVPFERTDGGHRRFALDVALRALAAREAPRKGIGKPEPDAPAGDRTARVGSGAEPGFEERLRLDGLAEDVVWERVRQELRISSESEAGHILHYAITEMLNNSIDHSDGSEVAVKVWREREGLRFEVSDDGVGAFERLRQGLELPDELTALQELSKGKRTTDPEHHTGEGIFFTSKALDDFTLASGSHSWVVDNLRGDHAIGPGPSGKGTVVSGAIDEATDRTMAEVFQEYTHDLSFDTSRVVVKLFEHGTDFVSRSEAKRVLDGLERFAEVIVDFAGVDRVGQGFADEVFRVWPSMHPDKRVVPQNMTPSVAFMVDRARR